MESRTFWFLLINPRQVFLLSIIARGSKSLPSRHEVGGRYSTYPGNAYQIPAFAGMTGFGDWHSLMPLGQAQGEGGVSGVALTGHVMDSGLRRKDGG